MKTSEKLKALERIEKEAGQEAINALGREVMALLSRHGFQPPQPEAKRPQKPATAPARKPPVGSSAPKRPVQPVAVAASANAYEPPPGTDAGRVLAGVRNHPALRGFELKSKVDAGGAPIKIKTFRTSLRRLKDRGLIRQDEDARWYPEE